jgi:hypothetical protein
MEGWKDERIRRKKKKFMRSLGLLMVVLMLGSCSREKQGTAIIGGIFTGAPGVRLVLEELVPGGIGTVDSLTTGTDGTFRFAVSPAEATFYLLKTGDGKTAVLTAAPGDTLELACDARAFPEEMVVKGTKDAEFLAEFFAGSYRNKALADSLQQILALHSGDSLFTSLTLSFDTVFQRLWKNQRELEIRFIEAHPGSIAAILVLDYSFGARPVLSMEEDPDCYRLVDSALTVNYPGNKHVQHFHRKIEEYTRKQQLDKGTVR